MTNHAFASSRGRISKVRFKTELEDILAKRFPDVFILNSDDDYHQILAKNPPENKNYSYLSVWLRSQRMFEMRSGHMPGSDWLQYVVQNELAYRFKGKCGNEGVPEK